MPYKTNNNLSDSVKLVLPPQAQTIFRKAFNSSSSRLSEDRAFAVAWTAVKNAGFRKVGDKYKRFKELASDSVGTKDNTERLINESFIQLIGLQAVKTKALLAEVTNMETIRKRMGLSVAKFYAIPRDPPSASKLPIFDAAHVRNAMARFNQVKGVSSKEKSTARSKIAAAAKRFKIDIKSFREQLSVEEQHKMLVEEQYLNTIKNINLKREVENLHFSFKINEELSAEDTELHIEGVALQEGTWNGVFYSGEILEESYRQLIGKPLRLAHLKTPHDIAGIVVDASYDPIGKRILFVAKVIDVKAQRLVKEGLLKFVSVGVLVEKFISDKGVTARDPEFKELSLVEEPACKTCGILNFKEMKFKT